MGDQRRAITKEKETVGRVKPNGRCACECKKHPKPKKQKDVVGRVKPNGRCKMHPEHRQSPGVCSVCLTEKLAQLTAPFSSCRRNIAACVSALMSSSSSSSCCCLSPASSLSASPVRCFRVTSSEGESSSISIPLLSQHHNTSGDREGFLSMEIEHTSVNKSGFWVNLFRPLCKRRV